MDMKNFRELKRTNETLGDDFRGIFCILEIKSGRKSTYGSRVKLSQAKC